MGKTAFIFPGQGAQFVGMGKDFYENFPLARQTYEEANDKLGLDIAVKCFEGPEDELLRTENTQPAILTTSIAILRVIKQEGFSCDFTAGLSLGEYSALVNAEAIDFTDAAKLVRNRGVYMQLAVPEGIGGMGAIIGLPRGALTDIIEYVKTDGIIGVANYNTQEQVVLSGERNAVKNALKKAKELGARKALLLPVSAPFHCSMLEPAGEMLKADLEEINLRMPRIPFINNAGAKIITDSSQIIPSLIKQISSPVLWQQSVEMMMEEGVRTFIEIGPGTALSNFVKSIASNMQIEVNSKSIGSIESLKLLNTVNE